MSRFQTSPHLRSAPLVFGLLLGVAACGDDSSVTAGGGGSGAGNGGNGGSDGGAGGQASTSTVIDLTGGGGSNVNEGCASCTPDEVCVDNTHCEAECPDDRPECWTNPFLSKICCPAGGACCPNLEPGTETCAASADECPLPCHQEAQCGDVCCPLGSRCTGGECLLADLSIDAERVESSLQVAHDVFAGQACEIVEGCVDGPGDRKLMRFDLKTPNFGDGDLFLGDPNGNDLFEYSSCHDHFHFLGYARYSLVDENGTAVANGHKQAFCLLDFEELGPNSPAPQYNCGYQGISAGWSDIYSGSLPCQWVDITDTPPGNYMLKVEVNFDEILAESDYTNNVALIPVTVTPDACPGGCGDTVPSCCADGDPCNLAGNGQCDCDGFYAWDAQECTACELCSGATSCPGGCTPANDSCCNAGNSCNLGTDGICQCAGTQSWDAVDCAQCVSADQDCGVVDSCPNGCTDATNAACCSAGDPCGWSGDASCDCNGIDWDFLDCSTCTCP